jgi:hypothetical protein
MHVYFLSNNLISARGKGYFEAMKKVLLILCLCSATANAQYFNNNAFQFILGWTGFDTTAKFLRPAVDPNPWPTSDQIQLGLGYQYALLGYDLWWVTQSSVSLGYAKNYSLSDTTILAGVQALTGLRYNFMTRAWRPFVGGGIGLYTLFTNPNAAQLQAGIQPSNQAWMMLQVGPGVEYIFTDEMSFQFDVGALAFFDFQREARFSYTAKLSYLFYF